MRVILTLLAAVDFRRQCGSPFIPGERVLFVECDGHGEGLGFPWFVENGLVAVKHHAFKRVKIKLFQNEVPTNRASLYRAGFCLRPKVLGR